MKKMDLEKTAKKIAGMTDDNDHTGAVLELAKYVGNKQYIEIMECVQGIHEARGYMDSNLMAFRMMICAELMEKLSAYDRKILEASF